MLASYSVSFVCTPWHIFMLVFGRDRWFCIGRARVQTHCTQCGETSTNLTEMQSSVSSVEVESKGSFIVFLVIKMSFLNSS